MNFNTQDKNELADRAKQIIEKILYITISTVSPDGQPWNSPVFSAYDKNYNFYWGSYQNSQHSKNIRQSGKAFLVIYDSTVEAGMGEGVYIKATATQLEESKDINIAHNLLQNRRPVPFWRLDQVQEKGPIRLYKAVPGKIWCNVDGELNGNFIDARKEIKLI